MVDLSAATVDFRGGVEESRLGSDVYSATAVLRVDKNARGELVRGH